MATENEKPLHYWGYGGKPTVGLLCGTLEDDPKTTSYALDVTCASCNTLLGSQIASAVKPPIGEVDIATEKKTLSSLAINDCGILNGRRFIVTSRFPEDRASGGTEIRFEDGLTEKFIWDHSNPLVAFLGQGRYEVLVKITWPEECR